GVPKRLLRLHQLGALALENDGAQSLYLAGCIQHGGPVWGHVVSQKCRALCLSLSCGPVENRSHRIPVAIESLPEVWRPSAHLSAELGFKTVYICVHTAVDFEKPLPGDYR